MSDAESAANRGGNNTESLLLHGTCRGDFCGVFETVSWIPPPSGDCLSRQPTPSNMAPIPSKPFLQFDFLFCARSYAAMDLLIKHQDRYLSEYCRVDHPE